MSDSIEHLEQGRSEQKIQQWILPLPDDGHIHLRDGPALELTVRHATEQFGRVIVMPNLDPPITDMASLHAYRQRILSASNQTSWMPYFTLYLNHAITAETLRHAQEESFFVGCKLYPQGVTTNAQHGVADLNKIEPLLGVLENLGIPLLIHGEHPDPKLDIFDREKKFIDKILEPWLTRFPGLKMSLEHITTEHAVQFIQEGPLHLGASITAHHLLLNRNDLLSGGIKPDYYCLPILKRHADQIALLKAATSGDPHFYLGTDSAPHPQTKKYQACGCAGIYTAHQALAFYAMAFDQIQQIEKLPLFIQHTSQFYGWAPPQRTVTLVRQSQDIPEDYLLGAERLTPFFSGQTLPFKVQRLSD